MLRERLLCNDVTRDCVSQKELDLKWTRREDIKARFAADVEVGQ